LDLLKEKQKKNVQAGNKNTVGQYSHVTYFDFNLTVITVW